MAQETASLVIKVDSSGAERATRNLDQLDRAAGGSERAANKLGKAWGVAIGIIGSAAVIGATRAYIRHADTMANLSARLRLVTGSQEEFNRAQEATFQIAQRSRTELDSVVDLYARMAQSTTELGLSQQDLIQLTETITQTFQISGATTQEAAGGLRQLSQAMAGGVLRAEEFNSIIESSPRLVQALADGMGIAFGDVRKYVNEGRISSEQLTRALLNQSQTIQTEFGNMPLTVGGAITQVQNSLKNLVGDVDEAEGASRGLAEAISALADELNSPAVREGFAAIVSGASTAVGWMARLATTTANVTKFLAESAAARVHGPAGDDIVRIEAAIERQQALVDKLDQKGTGAERRNESPYAQRMREELEALQAQADAYYANQEEMARRAKAIAEDANAPVTGGTVTNPTGTGGGNTRTTATRELAAATRELTAAEQEALAYSESLNAVGEETLRQRGQTSMAILEQQNATRDFIADLEFERSLIGLSNVEREKAIALRYANVDATTEEGRAIAGLIEEIERGREAESYVQDLKSGMGDVFTSIIDGSGRASDAFARMIDNLKRRAMDALADKAIDGLIQGFAGMAGGGGWGGFAAGFAKGFGGGRAGNGPVMQGQGYWVGEHGREWFEPAQNGSVVQGPAQGAPRVTINVQNAPAQVDRSEARMRPDGMLEVFLSFKDQIKGEIAGEIANGTGPNYAAMKGRFNLQDRV